MAVKIICDVCHEEIKQPAPATTRELMDMAYAYDPYDTYPVRVRLVSEPIYPKATGFEVCDKNWATGRAIGPTVLNEFIAHAKCKDAIHVHTR